LILMEFHEGPWREGIKAPRREHPRNLFLMPRWLDALMPAVGR
jgi:hypothetical protein